MQATLLKPVGAKSTRINSSPRRKDGLLMEILSASFASSKFTRMPNTVIHAHIPKEYVQCAGNKFWTPSFTNKAMYSMKKI